MPRKLGGQPSTRQPPRAPETEGSHVEDNKRSDLAVAPIRLGHETPERRPSGTRATREQQASKVQVWAISIGGRPGVSPGSPKSRGRAVRAPELALKARNWATFGALCAMFREEANLEALPPASSRKLARMAPKFARIRPLSANCGADFGTTSLGASCRSPVSLRFCSCVRLFLHTSHCVCACVSSFAFLHRHYSH